MGCQLTDFPLGILTLFVPELTQALTYGDNKYESGQSRLLGIFAGFNILAFLLIFFFVPDTAGATLQKDERSLNYMSLEELNYIFGVPTLQHIQYQLREVVPWCIGMMNWTIRSHLLRQSVQRPNDPSVLYTWVDIKSLQRSEKEKALAGKNGETVEQTEEENSRRSMQIETI